MGIIGDAFKKLFGFLGDAFGWLIHAIGVLFQPLVDAVIGFFKIIYDLIDGLLYLLYKIGVVLIEIFGLFWQLILLIYSFIVGFVRTLQSISFSVQGGSGNGFSETLGKIFDAASPLQINVIGYILLFLIWIMTAVTILKLLSSVRVGGD